MKKRKLVVFGEVIKSANGEETDNLDPENVDKPQPAYIEIDDQRQATKYQRIHYERFENQ
ncbi:MAG: hypothetical protein ACMVP2_24530 [Imperialibacter sp.]|uniref:hypothetical protein n=1 Tax=Imperialibacter sp. TaxID=2038411 RepID=UPI003A84C472